MLPNFQPVQILEIEKIRRGKSKMPALSVVRPPEHPDRLAALFEKRAELEAELRAVGKPDETRARAAAALAEAESGLQALDESDRAAWARWSDNPSGEQPTPRHDERRGLEQIRALAAADLRAAEAACAAVQPRLAKVSAEMRLLGSQISRCRLDDVLQEMPAIEQKIRDAARIVHDQVTSLQGLLLALSQEKIAAQSRGDEDTATAAQGAIVVINSRKGPNFERTNADIERAAATWRAALR
jgi:hypothetical protein